MKAAGRVARWVVSPLVLTCIALFWLHTPGGQVKAEDSALTFEGFHDIADCNGIVGWAWDSSQPNTVIFVDIYADGVVFATVPADQFRQDLVDAGKGNGYHGFSIATPESLKDGAAHQIRVRIAGSNIDLYNTPKTITCSQHQYEGFHDIADCTGIVGWAWDANQPNTPINVDVHIDGHAYVDIQAPANQFRQDLVDAGKGNGVHGFSFPTPNSLKDGHPHSIRITFSGTNIDLYNTPKTITCAANPQPAYEGFHDLTNCDGIVGWAWDANQPNTPISVDIYDGATKIATIPADQFRQDLLDAGKGNGVHGFFYPLPPSYHDGHPHTFSVGIAGTFMGLYNTPQTINCPVGSFEGFHDIADCNQIAGWAWDSGQPNSPISVDIYDGNTKFMTVAADQFRQDLVDAGKGNGAHGFSVATPNWLRDSNPHQIGVRIAGTNIALYNTPRTITCSLSGAKEANATPSPRRLRGQRGTKDK
ncbi:MAG TPA: hypothetical protein VKA60_26285 [Blastocatellia bacterium]|nr:hypothetical protein [Blastocatellia bacterium]